VKESVGKNDQLKKFLRSIDKFEFRMHVRTNSFSAKNKTLSM